MPNDSLLDILKLRNIFKPEDSIIMDDPRKGGITGNLPNTRQDIGLPGRIGDIFSPKTSMTSPMIEPGRGDISGLMNQMYQPDEYFLDEYKKVLESMPQMKSPGIGRRIAAIFAGDPEEQRAFLQAPYNREMGHWEARRKALEPALTAERYGNINERQIASTTAQNVLRERDITRKEQADASRVEIENKKLELSRLRAENWTLRTDETGMIYAVSPVTQEAKPTGIKSGDLSELEKIRLNLDSDLTKIAASARETRATEGVRQEGRLELSEQNNLAAAERARLSAEVQAQMAALRAELAGQNRWTTPIQAFDRDGKPLPYLVSTNGVTGESKKIPLGDDVVVRTTPPGTGSSSAVQSETQKAAGITNKAQQVATSKPEWAKYIKFDGTGQGRRFTGITRPGLIFGPSQEMYNQIYEAVYGEPFTATPANRTPATTTTTTAKTGRIRVKAPDGRTGTWDLSKGPIPTGFTEIK